MNTQSFAQRARDYVFNHQSPPLGNAIQITGQCLLATTHDIHHLGHRFID